MPFIPSNATLILNRFAGLNSSKTYAELAEDEFAIFQNCRLWNGGRKITQRRGQELIYTPTRQADLQGLSWQRLSGNEYLLAVVSGSVIDCYTGNPVSGGHNRFPGGADTNACWIDHKVILGDGVNPNCVAALSGSTLVISQLTADPCDASVLTLAAGAAGNPNGTYTYAVRFVSALGVEGMVYGYSPSVTVSNQKVSISNIPTAPAGNDCRARNLYRIKNGGASYFFLGQIVDNTTTTYTDNTADDSLGAPLGEDQSFPNTPMPPCRFWLAVGNRAYGAACFATTGAVTGSVNVVYVSDVLDPTTARASTDPSTSYQGGQYPLENPADGQITGLGGYGNMVVVFTGGSQYLFTGTQPSTFELNSFSTHGATSHRSVLSAQDYLIWLAPDGVYAWKAAGFVDPNAASLYAQRSYARISDRVRDRIDAMSADDMAKASAVFSDNRYWLSWPNGNLVYDLLYDAWYEDTGNHWRILTASVFTSDNRQRIYGAQLGSGTVWQLDTGTLDGTSGILCHLQTADLDVGLPGHNKRAAWVGGLFRMAPTATLSGSLIRNSGQGIDTWVIPLVSGSVWQVVPGNANVVRMRQRPSSAALSEFFQLDFVCESLTGDFEILSAQIEFVANPVDAGGTSG